MRKLLYLVICCVALSLTAMYCEDIKYVDIYLVNNSGEKVYFNYGYFVNPQKTKDPNKVMTSQLAFDYYYLRKFDSIQAGDTYKTDIFVKEYYDETWQFIVFKQSLMDNHTIDEIKEKNLFDTLFKYNYYELKQRNFTLVIR